ACIAAPRFLEEANRPAPINVGLNERNRPIRRARIDNDDLRALGQAFDAFAEVFFLIMTDDERRKRYSARGCRFFYCQPGNPSVTGHLGTGTNITRSPGVLEPHLAKGNPPVC